MKRLFVLWAFAAGLSAVAAPPSGSSETRLERRPRVWLGSPMSAGLDLAVTYGKYPNFLGLDRKFGDEPAKGFRIALEWIPFGEAAFGKLAFGLAGGYAATGDKVVDGTTTNLAVIPTEAYLAYRADLFHQQLLVPFAKIGTNFTFYKDPNAVWYVYPGLDWSVGLELCLSHLEPTAARMMDNQFGINDTYLLVEFTRSDFLGHWRGPDFRNDTVRVALRFEM